MQALLLVYNPEESAVLRLVLQRVGLPARITTNLEQAIENWPDQPSDLIFLACERADIPVQFIRQLRAFTNAPLVLITDPVVEDVQVAALDAGADLLINRPYSARLLMAQTRALLRRTSGTTFYNLPALIQGELELDPTLRIFRAGDLPPVRLTQLEFRLLHTLMTHPDKVYPAEALVEHVWGYSGSGDRDLVRGLIRRLRAKIEPEPNQPRYIITQPGAGYTFRTQEDLNTRQNSA